MKTVLILMAVMLLVFFVSACGPLQVPAVEQSNNGQQPQWWEVASGIVAIPVALMGLAYSYILIKKTNLESKKIQLEIVEKQSKLKDKKVNESEKSHLVATALVENQLAFNIILRFILLNLIYSIWEYVTRGYNILIQGLSIAMNIAAANYHTSFSESFLIFSYVLGNILTFLPQIGSLMIFLGLGWPLFKDVNRLLGIDIKSVFLSMFRFRRIAKAR
jgi:hypothetical protein